MPRHDGVALLPTGEQQGGAKVRKNTAAGDRGAEGARDEFRSDRDAVIPGCAPAPALRGQCTSGKSRDSGFDASHAPE